jgi:hypothetical protein
MNPSTIFPIIHRYHCPTELLAKTVEAFRRSRKDHVESILFWAGHVMENGVAQLRALILPTGPGMKREAMCSGIDSYTMAAVTDVLDPPGRILLAQVHTHPSEAFHSWTDDNFSWRSPGFLSIVLPQYGKVSPRSHRSWSYHRCDQESRYRKLEQPEVLRVFHVVKQEGVEVHECR